MKYFLGKFIGFFIGIISAYITLFAAIGVMTTVEKAEAANKKAAESAIKNRMGQKSSGMFS